VSKYLTVSLSVDALEWTGHWLGDRRCDLIAVSVARSDDVSPKVRMTAIESKARSDSEPIDVTLDAEPFKDGAEQVAATLDAMNEILCPEAAADVISDLKQSAFLEHLLSEVLARIYPVAQHSAMADTFVIKHLTRLSRRELRCGDELVLEGLVVTTQRLASVQTKEKQLQVPGEACDWPVKLVRCGVPQLRELFEEMGLEQLAKITIGDVTEAAPRDAAAVAGQSSRADEISSVAKATSKTVPPIGPGSQVLVGAELSAADAPAQASSLPQDVQDLVNQLDAALTLRQFPTEPIDSAMTVVGPTLISVPVVLQAGHSSKSIESATRDIARELGVRTVAVENDERAYHIRFLIPRRDRAFPPLPNNAAIAFDKDRGHYLGLQLGVGVDGKPFRSFVSEWPHLLVAGTTGSGKTTFLKSLLLQLATLNPSQMEIVIVDGKAEYDYIGVVPEAFFSRRFPEVLLGHENAPNVLRWLIEEEIPARREALRKYFTDNKSAPRQPRDALIQAWESERAFPMRPVVIFIDEFAEIMQAAGAAAREFEGLVQRAVQTGRSALVHLLLATQRPDASVIAGAIKANLPSRVALALPSHHDSMTILNAPGAEDLVGSGDMLFLGSNGGLSRLQAYSPY
jgi:hypothetical protein